MRFAHQGAARVAENAAQQFVQDIVVRLRLDREQY
jgi:hypothetical protein